MNLLSVQRRSPGIVNSSYSGPAGTTGPYAGALAATNAVCAASVTFFTLLLGDDSFAPHPQVKARGAAVLLDWRCRALDWGAADSLTAQSLA